MANSLEEWSRRQTVFRLLAEPYALLQSLVWPIGLSEREDEILSGKQNSFSS